jgi:hypothetical protein
MYLQDSLKNLKFLQDVLQRYTIIRNFLRMLNLLEVGIFVRAKKLESPCTKGFKKTHQSRRCKLLVMS